MNDITVIDLFWLILKFLAALGLVGVVGAVLYFGGVLAAQLALISWDILRGRNASVAATVCFALALVVLVTGIIVGVGYFQQHPVLFH